MNKGFTLIELLIVIAIIGIMVSIAVASYSTTQQKSRDVRRIDDMKALQNAWEQYYADNASVYPGPVNPASPAACTIAMMSTPATYLPGGFPPDPKSGTPYPQMYDGWSRCGSINYCFCAGVEIASNGNSPTDCTGAATAGYSELYCVKNLQ